MFSSLIAPAEENERLPKSSFPWVWLGFVFAVAFFAIEIVAVVSSLVNGDGRGFEIDPLVTGLLMLVSLGGWIYWLVCIYQLHKILAEISSKRYPIDPAEAVGKHFIPFFNLYWIFKWPSEMSDYINQRGRIKMVSGGVIGLFFLLALLGRFVDGAVGLTGLFATTVFVSYKLRQHVSALKGTDPNKLPPLPDPQMFRTPQETTVSAPTPQQ
jgi:hypothetical protein